jgi:Transglycosylase SLT domain
MARLSARRVAAVSVAAVLGLAVHSGVPRVVRLGPAHPAVAAPVASTSPARTGAAGTVAVPFNRTAAFTRDRTATAPRSTAAIEVSQADSFRQIILPDILVVAARGLTPRQITELKAIKGVRDMITFDGARISAGGRLVNVIGVSPAAFRSWVPLRTASDQAFWSALADGDFVAASTTASGLGLKTGDYYQLAGATSRVLRYGAAAQTGLTGINLLVNKQVSAQLGLVRQVAGLISAPSLSIGKLTGEVSSVLGPSGKIEVLRSQKLPVAAVPAGGKPTSYLQLFKASAAMYCPGLSWTVLASIGQIESADGTNVGPSSAGALGPMQFLPGTWAAWGIDGFGDTGKPDVMNPYDAVPSAARLLCADGAAAGGQALRNAIFDYNHAWWYVDEVLALAAEYAADYS